MLTQMICTSMTHAGGPGSKFDVGSRVVREARAEQPEPAL
jgi:hypothetical protein